jgi:hypothetical protein
MVIAMTARASVNQGLLVKIAVNEHADQTNAVDMANAVAVNVNARIHGVVMIVRIDHAHI